MDFLKVGKELKIVETVAKDPEELKKVVKKEQKKMQYLKKNGKDIKNWHIEKS